MTSPSPTPPQRPTGVSWPAWQVERFLAWLAILAYTRAPAMLAAVLLATAAFGFASTRLGLNTDITQLLPESFESVRDVKRITEEFGGVGYVSIIVEGENKADLIRFAEDAAPKLEQLPTVRYVDYKRPVEFFQDRALYFLDKGDLETVRDRLERRRDWEVSKATGALLDENESAPPVDFSDLEARYKDKLQLSGGQSDAKRDPRYYVSEDGKMLALLVKPTKLASDFAFCKEVTADVERVLSTFDLSQYGQGTKFELSGRYKKRVDVQNVIGRDLQFASLAAFVLILAYISFHFRRVSAVLLVFLPLGFALAATYGFAAMTIGSLNVLTSFVGAIILGLGVDNGIHLLNRYYEERSTGLEPVKAVRAAFGEAARASSAAMLTNVGAFLSLTIADFKAFREFGVLAASGMFFTLIGYVIVVPLLLGLGARLFKQSAPTEAEKPLRYAAPLVRWAPAVFYAMSLLVVFATSRIPYTGFNYDFSVMDEADLPSFHLDRQVNKLLGGSQTPLLVFADSDEEAEITASTLRKRKAERGDASTIQRVVTISELVPKGQAEKAPIVEEIGEIAGRLRDEGLDADKKKQRDLLLQMAAAKPFAKADLPTEVTRQFQRPGDNSLAHFVLIYPAVSMSDGRMAQKVATEVRGIELDDGKLLHASGEPLVLADILTSMQKDLPIVFMVALTQQVLLLWLLMGSLERGLLTLFPAVITMPLLVGLLPFFGLSLDYLNVILIPTLLGMGEDGGAHLVARVSGGDKLEEALGYTARGTFGAGITSMFGFGAMVVATHPGLRSFGLVAVIGIGLNLVVCLLFLPSLIALLDLRRSWKQSGKGGLWTQLVTVGMAGATPRGGGTVGAMVALPVAWLMGDLPIALRVSIALGAVAVSVLAAQKYLALRPEVALPGPSGEPLRVPSKDGDPQEIVLDEFVGALLAMAMVSPHPLSWLTAFALFRVFDIVKPWPVSAVERRLKGAGGVIADDVVAGVLAGAVTLGLERVIALL